MVNILRKEHANRYIKELAEKVSYWLNREGWDSEVYRRSLARSATAKAMYEMLTGEEYTQEDYLNER